MSCIFQVSADVDGFPTIINVQGPRIRSIEDAVAHVNYLANLKTVRDPITLEERKVSHIDGNGDEHTITNIKFHKVLSNANDIAKERASLTEQQGAIVKEIK